MARRADKLREELATFDQEVGSRQLPSRQIHKVLPVTVAFVALFCFGGLTWYAYNQGILEGSEEAAPYLRPNGPLKTAPSNPGGVEIPNRDKFVYNRLENRSDDEKVERLLPPPEQPRPLPATQSEGGSQTSGALSDTKTLGGSSKNLQGASVTSAEDSQSIIKPQPSNANEVLRRAIERADKGGPPALKAPAATTKPVPSDLNVKDTSLNPSARINRQVNSEVAQTDTTKKPIRLTPGGRSANKKATSVTSETAMPKKPERQLDSKSNTAIPTEAAIRKGYFIQLGALRSRAAAERAWQKARGKNPNLLGSRRLTVEQANIPKKGRYFRVLSGPLANANAAKKLCDALKRRKQGCFVAIRR